MHDHPHDVAASAELRAAEPSSDSNPDTALMGDSSPTPSILEPAEENGPEVVSTHVLVSQEQVHQLRQLSRRTRIAQSEYLREAVDDLLSKYGKGEPRS